MRHTIGYVCKKIRRGVNKHLSVWVKSSGSEGYRWMDHINDLLHKRHDSIAKALELHLFSIKSSNDELK